MKFWWGKLVFLHEEISPKGHDDNSHDWKAYPKISSWFHCLISRIRGSGCKIWNSISRNNSGCRLCNCDRKNALAWRGCIVNNLVRIFRSDLCLQFIPFCCVSSQPYRILVIPIVIQGLLLDFKCDSGILDFRVVQICVIYGDIIQNVLSCGRIFWGYAQTKTRCEIRSL